MDIIRTVYYIHCPWRAKKNFCCFICVSYGPYTLLQNDSFFYIYMSYFARYFFNFGENYAVFSISFIFKNSLRATLDSAKNCQLNTTLTVATSQTQFGKRICHSASIFSYPRDAVLARYLLSSCVCPSVCLSVTSRCVLLRRLNLGSCKQRHTIDQRL